MIPSLFILPVLITFSKFSDVFCIIFNSTTIHTSIAFIYTLKIQKRIPKSLILPLIQYHNLQNNCKILITEFHIKPTLKITSELSRIIARILRELYLLKQKSRPVASKYHNFTTED